MFEAAIKQSKKAATPEPAPTKGKKLVLPHVVNDLMQRDQLGKKKYGTSLETHNGRSSLWDCYQEMLDAVMYLRKHLLELEDEKKAPEPKQSLITPKNQKLQYLCACGGVIELLQGAWRCNLCRFQISERNFKLINGNSESICRLSAEFQHRDEHCWTYSTSLTNRRKHE